MVDEETLAQSLKSLEREQREGTHSVRNKLQELCLQTALLGQTVQNNYLSTQQIIHTESKRTTELERVLNGEGTDDSPGLTRQVDRLIQVEKVRGKVIGVIVATTSTLLVKVLFDALAYFSKVSHGG